MATNIQDKNGFFRIDGEKAKSFLGSITFVWAQKKLADTAKYRSK
jgi:hypothetical protein